MSDIVLYKIAQAEETLKDKFKSIDDIALYNQKKVLEAFREHKVATRHFAGTTGYGYDDIGRDTLCRIYARVLGAEEAIVSPNIVSGTHALTIALFSALRPGDEAVSVTGEPYDTLNDVIYGKNNGSLADYKIRFTVFDQSKKEDYLNYIQKRQPKAVFIQRSRGYTSRNALSINEIERIIKEIKNISADSILIVDNCYGEFTEKREPTEVGADLIAGSLIKNAGGGLAPTGGYIAGKKSAVIQASYRLTSPSIGNEVGSYEAGYRSFYQGLFYAPHVTAQALKGCFLFAETMRSFGCLAKPEKDDYAGDIICSICFDSKEKLIAFVQAVQRSSPVDSYVTPEPWDMPGYENQVIMAAGCFVAGASIELSCDSPIKEPYIAYIQGGLSYEHIKIAVEECAKSLVNVT